jgi:hypothetical protein
LGCFLEEARFANSRFAREQKHGWPSASKVAL